MASPDVGRNQGAPLFPKRNLSERYFISGRALDRALAHQLGAFADRLPKNGVRAADVGCGRQPYRRLLERYADEYVGMDVQASIADGYAPPGVRPIENGRLPSEDHGFDLILSSQVVEHVEHLQRHIEELYRILKPGGLLFLSTHGNFVKHDHDDFWRWTDRGLEVELTRHGFVVENCIPVVTGHANLCLHAIQAAAHVLSGKGLRRAFPPVSAALNTLGRLLDRTPSSTSDWWPCMYLVVSSRR